MVDERKMNVNRKLRYCIPIFISGLTVCMTGCSYQLDYTDEEKEIIVDYAAAAVMKHDENLYGRYLYDLEDETTTKLPIEDETDVSTNPLEKDTADKQNGQEETTETTSRPPVENTVGVANPEQLTKALGLHGLTAEYLDFAVTSQYPYESKEDAIFVMRPTKNTKLLSVKFRITNPTNQDIALNMMESGRRYVAVLNDKTQVKVQLSLLLDALNTFEGTFKPGESKELVLVYQVKAESKEELQHLDIIFADSEGRETKIRFK